MSIRKIPLDVIQKVRQHIKTSLTLPESENRPPQKTFPGDLDEVPEPDSLDALGDLFKFVGTPEEVVPAPNAEGRWFISAINPGSAINRLPGLKLKPDFRLVTYLYRVQEGGVGVTYAVPEILSTTAQLESALSDKQTIQTPPIPQGSLADLMEAIEGDFSPPSFIVASILKRELQEVGKLGQQSDWTHHRLIEAIPPQVQWKWRIETPKDFSPKVLVLPDGRAAVEFFTCRVTAPIGLYRYIDQYPIGSYLAKCGGQVIATP